MQFNCHFTCEDILSVMYSRSWPGPAQHRTLARAAPILAAAVISSVLFVTLNRSLNEERNISLSSSFITSTRQSPVIEISNGKVRGTTLKSREGRLFYTFYHIPYGEPPVGRLRFQPPRRYTSKWTGTFDATKRGGVEIGCLQYSGFEIWGQEDCLNLIVYTPYLPTRGNPRQSLPVMVYIYGGIFRFGRANQYGPEYIMDEDVVYAAIDFRTGPFGHLNTEDSEIRGNMALKDQVLALKWIQENIEHFGGDPKRVLIFGNSSGGACVNGHLISKMSQGLFSRAVSQSGSVAISNGYNTTALQGAQQLGQMLNCTNVEDTQALHDCLVDADPADIAMKYSELYDVPQLTKEWTPENGDLSDVFFEDYPLNMLANGSFYNKIPWLAGVNNAENYPQAYQLLTNPWAVHSLNHNWQDLAPAFFNFKDTTDHHFSYALRDKYFGSRRIDNETRYELVDIFSDIQSVWPVKHAVDLFARNGGSAYFYFMSHEPIMGNGDPVKPGFKAPFGAAHADEIQYLFPWVNEKNQSFPFIDKHSPDYATSKNMVKVWANFARDGYPSLDGVSDWNQIDGDDPTKTSWLEINDRCELTDKLRDRMELLNSVPFRTTTH